LAKAGIALIWHFAKVCYMEPPTPKSVGLGGDGDEIEAIMGLEAAFGVKLDYTAAHQWATAGDVFAALKDAMPPSENAEPGLWERFATALCAITGVDPNEITPTSPLLSQNHYWNRIANPSAAIWMFLALGLAAAIGASFLRG
jgi:hypothetical protein